jgi:hypothetical protein
MARQVEIELDRACGGGDRPLRFDGLELARDLQPPVGLG